MLVGMKREVSVLVAVGRTVRTGVGVLVVDGMTGIGIVAESFADVVLTTDGEMLTVAGADDAVAIDSEGERVGDAADEVPDPVETDPEADGDTEAVADGATEVESVADAVMVALLWIEAEEVMVSEAEMVNGVLRDSLGEIVALDDTPVPTEVDGTIPEETSVPDSVNVGNELEEPDTVALSEGDTLSVPVGRGEERLPEPDTVAEGRMPDDRRVDENSDAMLDAMLLRSEVGIGRGTDAVGRIEAEVRADSALDTRLEMTLGNAEPVGRSETADDKRLDSSEITDGTTDGRIPEADGDSVMVADAGAVGLIEPELGVTPVGSASETAEDRSEDRSSPELVEAPSEVGIAPDGEAPLGRVADAVADSVPSAVVMPMMIPLEGKLLEASPVGTTPLLGRIPDSTAEVGVGAAVLRRDDKKDSITPADDVGCTMSEDAGRSPVEASCVGSGRSDEMRSPAEDVGCTMLEDAGSRPVGATCSEL